MNQVIVKSCGRYNQQLNEQFMFALQHGTCSLLIVPSRDDANRAFSFFKARSSHVYLDNEEISIGFHIVVKDSVSQIKNFCSVGIITSEPVSCYAGIIEGYKFPILITNIDPKVSGDYWANVKEAEYCPTYPTSARLLENEEIQSLFLDTFLIANKEINIISPWISKRVVNEQFIGLIDKALSRGVSIKIVYGIGNGSDDRTIQSDNVVELLREKFSYYGHKLSFKKDNTHIKLVLCDNKFMMMGSFNFLSFSSDYSDEGERSEAVDYVVEPQVIAQRKIHYFSW